MSKKSYVLTIIILLPLYNYWTHFASSTSENMPAAMGAAEDVPLNSSVHLWNKSVVICEGDEKQTNKHLERYTVYKVHIEG